MNFKTFTQTASLNLSDEILTIHIEDAVKSVTPFIAFLITSYLITQDMFTTIVRRFEFLNDEIKERFENDSYQDDMSYILENCDEDDFDAEMGKYLAGID